MWEQNEECALKKPRAQTPRYTEDFFGVTNEVAVKPSQCAAGNIFSTPC